MRTIEANQSLSGLILLRETLIILTDCGSNLLGKLLAELDGLPESERSARFVSVICVCRPDGERLLVRGESEGIILDAPRGEGTFGYDPLFLCKKLGRTFAELDNDTKNSVSHRGAAIAELVKNIDFIIG